MTSDSKLMDTTKGREVLIPVRPEKIKVCLNEFDNTVNTFSGYVKNYVFVGPYYDIFFQCGDVDLRIQKNEIVDIEKGQEVYPIVAKVENAPGPRRQG